MTSLVDTRGDAEAVRALAGRATPAHAVAIAALERVVDTPRASVRRPALVGLARAEAVHRGNARVCAAIEHEIDAASLGNERPVLEGPDGLQTLRALGIPFVVQ